MSGIRDILTSKKYLMALTAVLVGLGAKLGLKVDDQTVALLVSPLLMAIFGQGLADHGKEAAKITADNPAPVAPAVVQQNINEPPKTGGAGVAAMLALLLFGGLALAPSMGCRGYEPPGPVRPVIDCLQADRPAIQNLILSFVPTSGAPDWASIESQAINAGTSIGGCAIAEFVQHYLAPARGTAAPPPEQANAAHDVLEDFREKHAGGATFKTSEGAL